MKWRVEVFFVGVLFCSWRMPSIQQGDFHLHSWANPEGDEKLWSLSLSVASLISQHSQKIQNLRIVQVPGLFFSSLHCSPCFSSFSKIRMASKVCLCSMVLCINVHFCFWTRLCTLCPLLLLIPYYSGVYFLRLRYFSYRIIVE